YTLDLTLCFDTYLTLQYLHSFPTRRSSDLRRSSRRSAPAATSSCSSTRSTPSSGPGRPRVRSTPRASSSRCSPAVSSRPSGPRRSEEHTSELQSRENLVCRLLLEKKKKQLI